VPKEREGRAWVVAKQFADAQAGKGCSRGEKEGAITGGVWCVRLIIRAASYLSRGSSFTASEQYSREGNLSPTLKLLKSSDVKKQCPMDPRGRVRGVPFLFCFFSCLWSFLLFG
jgi:hypothetical protein